MNQVIARVASIPTLWLGAVVPACGIFLFPEYVWKTLIMKVLGLSLIHKHFAWHFVWFLSSGIIQVSFNSCAVCEGRESCEPLLYFILGEPGVHLLYCGLFIYNSQRLLFLLTSQGLDHCKERRGAIIASRVDNVIGMRGWMCVFMCLPKLSLWMSLQIQLSMTVGLAIVLYLPSLLPTELCKWWPQEK